MKRRTRYLGMIAGGLFALSVYASQSYAITGQCSSDTTFWVNATLSACNMLPAGTAQASSFSGINGDGSGNYVLVANLTGTSGVPAGHRIGARAVGLDLNGNPITGCETGGTDFNTSQGSTVGDGFGCNDAKKHRLIISLGPIPPPL